MNVEAAKEYDNVRDALLRAFRCTVDSYREKFRDAKRVGAETYEQFVTRTKLYLDRWLHLAKGKEDFESLYDMIMQEQFTDSLPADLNVFIRERKPECGCGS